eukprot:1161625-Pelagomonas_calceolata.AAC.4
MSWPWHSSAWQVDRRNLDTHASKQWLNLQIYPPAAVPRSGGQKDSRCSMVRTPSRSSAAKWWDTPFTPITRGPPSCTCVRVRVCVCVCVRVCVRECARVHQHHGIPGLKGKRGHQYLRINEGKENSSTSPFLVLMHLPV